MQGLIISDLVFLAVAFNKAVRNLLLLPTSGWSWYSELLNGLL